MKNLMEKFVISLSDSVIRRNHIKKEFDRYGIGFKFFDAINKTNIDEFQSKYNISFDEGNFSIGEKACFASHVVLWDYCISNNLEYIIIFEDDILLSVNSNIYLNDLKWIPEGIDLIKFEKFVESVAVSFGSIKIKQNSELRVLQQPHMGTAGYILSLNGAKKLFDKVVNNKQVLHIDQVMFNENIYSKFMDVYQMLPALVIQADRYGSKELPSQLHAARLDRMAVEICLNHQKLHRPILVRIKRELSRFVLRIKRLLFGKIKIDISDR